MTDESPIAEPVAEIAPSQKPRSRRKIVVGVAWRLVVTCVVFAGLSLAVGINPLAVFGHANPAKMPPLPRLSVVVAEPAVTEAIDLPKAPTLGTPWHVSGDTVDNDSPALLITPCGVLVTIITRGGYDYKVQQVVGYDIAAGVEKWSIDLPRLGLASASLSSWYPTYSSDCHMLMTLKPPRSQASADNSYNRVELWIDLATGEAQPIRLPNVGSCSATAAGWAGCKGYPDAMADPDSVVAINLNDPGAAPVWTQPITDGGTLGDNVVAGRIWTPAGYRDPASGTVEFGADNTSGDPSDRGDWVLYFAPAFPGGYDSGLAIRVSKTQESGTDVCRVALWDPETDSAIWKTPGTIPCLESAYGYRWGVAGQALIVTCNPPSTSIAQCTTTAFGLSTGQELWSHTTARPNPTGWDLASTWTWTSPSPRDHLTWGLSQAYMFFTDGSTIRISDGKRVNLSRLVKRPLAMISAASIMVYNPTGGYNGHPGTIAAFATNANWPWLPPRVAWSVDLGLLDTSLLWSFSTGGRMYIVVNHSGSAGLDVIPLME